MPPTQAYGKTAGKITDAEKKKKKQGNNAMAAGATLADLTANNDAKKAGGRAGGSLVMCKAREVGGSALEKRFCLAPLLKDSVGRG